MVAENLAPLLGASRDQTLPISVRLRQAAHTRTPMCRLYVHSRHARYPVWLKLEQYNPTGSLKYRTALSLLAELDESSGLTPGTRVVESTSGNLGLALSTILAELDCTLIVVVDPKVPGAVRSRLTRSGAALIEVTEPDEHGGYLLTRLQKVRSLLAADSALLWTDQYNSPANPAIHRDTIAREILDAVGGSLDAVIVAVSTGGTLAGISAGIRAAVPGVEILAVDALGSMVTGGPAHRHLLTGIGATRASTLLHRKDFGYAVRVADTEAFARCRMLAEDTGLRVGGSSGAVLVGVDTALRHGRRKPVAVLADGGDNYADTLYCDDWLAEKGVLAQVRQIAARSRAAGLHYSLPAGA